MATSDAAEPQGGCLRSDLPRALWPLTASSRIHCTIH